MILIFFLLSVNFSGAEVNNSPLICPESFSCSDTTTFKYPFYNVKDPGCGLIKVNCTPKGGEIQIGGQSYLIVGMLNVNMNYPILLVWNMTFSHLLKNKKCEALVQNFNFPSPNPLLYSISLNGFITIFKCTENLTYFEQHNYNSYNRCKDHIFYYNYFNTSVPSDLPQTCQVVQLPMKLSTEAGLEETNIFSLLNPVTSIGFQLTPSCSKCNEKGRHCNAQNGYDHCSEDKWEKPGIKHSRERMIKILVSVLGVGSVILIIMVILCLREITKWRKKAKYNVKVEIFLKNHEFLAPKRYSYAQVKKMTNSFKFKLGQGGFSTVYKGVLGNQNLVAVKVLNDLKGDGEDFINEVASVGKTSHVNIVCLVGFCLEGRKRALIYEFMPNGSLERFIYSHGSSSSSQLGWEKLHHIAIGIARGLEYLHRGCSTRILHFDIKPHNILLDSDFCPKISDFGLAKALFREKESKICMSNMRGTPGYIAPELFSRNFGEVSHKSDVYSYGMMILEMVGGRKNIAVGVDHTSELYFPHWIYKKVELHEEQLGILKEIVSDEENRIARKMIIVGLWCIQTNPLSRPTITEVLEMLEGDLQSLEIPPKPFFSSPPRCDGSPSSHPSGLCSST